MYLRKWITDTGITWGAQGDTTKHWGALTYQDMF